VPLIAVVVPCYNEERFIGDCLDRLEAVDRGGCEVSVIVIDNGSTDGTIGILEKKKAAFVSEPDTSISGLRNRGARRTEGEFLGFVDADCLVSRDWAANALRAFSESGDRAGIVGAPYDLPEECSWIERTWNLVTSGSGDGRGPTRWIPAGNMIVRRKAFDAVGGFDETLSTNEDVDFCDRVRAAGFEVLRDPGVSAVHLKFTTSLGHFFRRQRWHGKGAWDLFFRSLPEIRNGKVVAFTLVFLLSLAGLPVAAAAAALGLAGKAIFWIPVAGLLLPPVILATAACGRHRRWKSAPGLALLFLLYAAARSMSLRDALCPGKGK